MSWYKTTLNNKLYILRTADSTATEATQREKLEAYLIGMSHPTVSLSNNNETATILFTPFPNDIAQIIVDTKAVQFGVVRHISAGRSHRKSHSSIQGSRYYSKQSRGDNGFNYQN